MDVGAAAIEVLGTTQCLKRVLIPALLEVNEPKPMLQLDILRPTGDRSLRDPLRISESPRLQITEHQPAVHLNALWGQLPRLLENLCRAGKITLGRSSLSLSQ